MSVGGACIEWADLPYVQGCAQEVADLRRVCAGAGVWAYLPYVYQHERYGVEHSNVRAHLVKQVACH